MFRFAALLLAVVPRHADITGRGRKRVPYRSVPYDTGQIKDTASRGTLRYEMHEKKSARCQTWTRGWKDSQYDSGQPDISRIN